MKAAAYCIGGFAIACVFTQFIWPGHTAHETFDRIFWVTYGTLMHWWVAVRVNKRPVQP